MLRKLAPMELAEYLTNRWLSCGGVGSRGGQRGALSPLSLGVTL